MNIQKVIELHENGTLSQLYKAGFISEKIFTYFEIYLWIDLQIKTRGLSKNQAVLEASVHFNKDRATIWRSIGKFSNN